jgi:hypothetical protein
LLDFIRRLYLVTGDASVALVPDQPFLDGWDNVQAAAAIGDYHTADIYLEQMLRQREHAAASGLLNAVRDQTVSPRSTPSLGERVRGAFQNTI